MLFIIILVLTIICGYFFPWWFAVVIAFSMAFMLGKKPGVTFLIGFAALFTAWTIMALLKSIPNHNALATRVAHLFQLPNWVILLIVTAFIGGLVGGMSALSGILLRKAFTK
ncbi:MAG: hypothetical protein JST19_05020 [Bacteroidetes bacterium]|nr:hypothetical protein [Bacteroidota bacterium]